MTPGARALPTVLLIASAACGGATNTRPVNAARDEAASRVVAATAIIRGLDESSDSAIPLAIAKGARCVAIVPGLLHGGVLLAARAGRGVVSCFEEARWTVPAFFTMSGASAGLAAGVERVDLVMLVMTDAGEKAVLEGKLRIGTDTSITAGPIGRNAEVGAEVTLSAPILYYSRSKGLFVGLDLSGTLLERDEESQRAFYGDARDFGALLRSPAPPPPAAGGFRDQVARTFRREGDH